MTVLAQQLLHPAERALEEASGALISHHRAHLASQFAEVSGEEALVLPIEARRQQEFVAVKICSHPHLDAFDEFHQYEACLQHLGARELVEHRAYVPAVGQPPHVVVDGRVGPVELQDVAGRILLQEIEGRRSIGKFPVASDREAGGGEDPLRIGAIILEAIAIRAAADDVEPLAPQFVLHRAPVLGDILE